jgi:teichuronic acid exporter
LALYADVQTGPIVLGIFFGPAAVGLYKIADRLMSNVVTIAMSSIQAVALPQFSRLQDSPKELAKSVLACVRMSSTATLPTLAGLAAVSYPLMAIVGPNWTPASGALKVLCIAGMGAIFTYFTGPLMQALGKPHLVAILTWIRTLFGCLILGAAGWLARHTLPEVQVFSIAVARLILTILFDIPFYVYFLLKLANVSLYEFTNSAMPSIVSASGVAVILWLLQSSDWFARVNPMTLLLADIAIGGIVGIGALVLADNQLRGLLQAWWKNRAKI